MGTMLVTGGTGAIGAPFVGRTAKSRAIDEIVVLTRAPEAGRQRALLEAWNDSAAAHVRLASGDLQTLAHAGELSRDVTHIVHLAADTRFTNPLEQARDVNVGGTAAVLDFARRCPRLQRVACASTVYVAGLRTGTIREPELHHDDGFANPYEASKNEMEALVRSVMGELPVSVCRLSTAVGEGAAEASAFNAFHTAIRLLYAGLVPMIPGSADTRVDLISPSFAARSLAHLVGDAFEPSRTYHVCAGRSAPLLADVLDTAMDTMRAHKPAWRRRAVERPVMADEATYDLFVRSVQESGDAAMISATRAVDSFARQLSRPKVFDTREADAALAGVVDRTPPLALCRDVVVHCISGWKKAA